MISQKILNHSIDRLKKPDLITEEILFFRGLENTEYDLIPSIARRPQVNTQADLTWFEGRFIQARRKLPNIFGEEEYPLNLLTKP